MLPTCALEELEKTYEGKLFAKYWKSNYQQVSKLESKVTDAISDNNLSASLAKGFLEYMKLVIDGRARLPKSTINEAIRSVENAIEKSDDDRVLNPEEFCEITNHIKRRIAQCLGKKPNKPTEAMLSARVVKAIEDEYVTLNKIRREDLADVHELIDCWNPEN